MTNPYFRQVPNFEYISRNPGEKYISDYIQVKNLFKRGKLREDIFGNLNFFEKYSIIGDERPDNVAAKFYDDPTLDWVVLLSNNILNIQSEWPMTQQTFDKVMLEKYGSYDNLYNPHHYETTEIKNSLGITVLKSGIKVSPTWRTNGNFIETIFLNVVQNGITALNDGLPSNIVTVTIRNAIGIQPGDQFTIEGVSSTEYNGKFIVKEVYAGEDTSSVIYELPSIPKTLNPVISTSGKEKIIFTLETSNSKFLNISNDGIARYYEYWDEGFGYSVLVPRDSFVREVTNYEYELSLNETKRNIYVLKPQYLNVVFNDMDDIMPYKEGSQQYVTETLKRGDNIRLYE